MQRPIRVLIADDQPLVRTGLSATLAGVTRIEVVGEAVDGRDAVRESRLREPDVVLMDVRMPRMDGVQATRELREDPRLPDLRVLMLSAYDDDEHVFAALRAGASGFLLKNSPTEKVVEGVLAIASGESFLAPSVATSLVNEFLGRPPMLVINAPEVIKLTEREFDVFRYLVSGYRNEEIADMLLVGESTVKSHVQHLYRKLGVRDRVQVVIYAYEHGLLQPGIGLVSPDRMS